MRYVYLPPSNRQTITVNGKMVSRGEEFDAAPEFAARQPAGWCVSVEEHAAQKHQAESEAAADKAARRSARAEAARRGVRFIDETTETAVAAVGPDDPELAELNAAADAESAEGDAKEGDTPPAAPPKRGPGRPPKSAQLAPKAEA